MASEAAEVAEDYRLALEDLSGNLRFEISNLTVIARENTEHALAIAEVLQQHILKAPPNKKLPALYVLDSIVKNVGTPYTLYFGRNLFKTFMESYAVVDNNIRKKMEEMLRTWKDPVPGSMDTRPVFSHELVRPIENALMKARAASMPQQQQGQLPGRPRPNMMSHRDTPTPPGMRPGAAPAGYPQQPYPQHGAMPGQVPYPGQQHAAQYPPQAAPQPYGSVPGHLQHPGQGAYGSAVAGPPASAGVSVETLSNDIQNLIVATRAEFSQNPHDASLSNRLKALLDLQGVLQSTSLPPDQLELIKNKVNELAAVTIRATPAQHSTPTPAPVPPPPQAHSASVTPSAGPGGPFSAPQVTLDSLLGPGALAALLARQSATPQNSTPNPPPYAIRSPPPAPMEAPKPPPPAAAPAAAAANPLGLLEQLRKAGLIPAAGSPANNAMPIPPPAALPANLASILSQAKANAAARPGFDAAGRSLFDPAALKQQFNPAVISSLYDGLGTPCTQCGRRFKTDEEGRRKKTAHMDWHFRVHQRSTEAEKRGTHRSWYVDQQDWLKSREVVDTDHVVATDDSAAQDAKNAAGSQPKYIPVPDSSSGINTVCPICQDKFENQWLDAAQEWVWLDAVLVGNRAYHASCHAEATRDREATPGFSRRTPEPILGKRKAEVSISSPKIRSLKTSA